MVALQELSRIQGSERSTLVLYRPNKSIKLARVDWIHWIVSAKQAKTRAKRISDACSKLAAGERRVCCFDVSGFYSKALKAPMAADPEN